MALLPLGVVWFLGCVLGGFIYLVGSPLASVLSLGELAAAAVPVGTIAAAWVAFIVASLFSNLGYGNRME